VSFGQNMRRGVTWSTIAYVAGKGIGLIALVILARLLMPADFGVVAAVLAYLALIELGSDLGMNATVVYEQERGHSARLNVAFTLNLIVAAVLSAGGVLLAPLIAGFFSLDAHADLFRLAALNPIIAAFGNIHDSVLLRDLRFRRRTITILVRGVARGCVAIALAAAGAGAASIVIGMLAGTMIWAATLWILVPFKPGLSLERAVVRDMVAYGSGAAALEVVALITTRADVVVVARVLGPVALGLYTIAFRIPEILIESVAWNVTVVAFPALSRQRLEDRARLGDAALKLVRWQSLYAAPMATLLAITAPPLIVILFGSSWAGAGPVGSALAVMFGISAVAFPLGDVYRALGRQRWLALINVGQLALVVAGIIAVAPSGIIAVAWVRTGAQLAQAVVLMSVAAAMLPVPARAILRSLRPAAVGALGMGLGAGVVRILLPAPEVGALLAEVVSGVGWSLIALRLAAPATVADARHEFGGMLAGRLRRGRGKATPAWHEASSAQPIR
jgi:PST family polysaccharide transporter